MSVNLDRFAQGPPNPADAKVMAECAGCGGEIYEGEDVYIVNGDITHLDYECLMKYIDPEVATVEEALGVKS
jgi:hypothetical protein